MTTQNGFAIRAFRQRDRLTVTMLAEILGISDAHYRKIEAETRDAQPEHIAALAKAFNVTAAALVRTPPGATAPLSAASETVKVPVPARWQ